MKKCALFFVLRTLFAVRTQELCHLEIKEQAPSTKDGLATTNMLIRINDSDNRTIGRRVLTFERKARFLSAAPENEFADAGAGCVDRHHWLALRRKIFVERLNDQQLTILGGIAF